VGIVCAMYVINRVLFVVGVLLWVLCVLGVI
jgi:hypothetical protein